MQSGPEQKVESEQDTLPAYFKCPISLGEMTDPVMDLKGQSADRENMIQFALTFGHCLLDIDYKMTPQQVIPNPALKYAIKDYKEIKNTDLITHYRAISIQKIEELTAYQQQLEHYLQIYNKNTTTTYPAPGDIIHWPFAMLCPHSLRFFTDPVTTPYGNSYEKSAINTWLSHDKQTTDPLTLKPLTRRQLVSNVNLRDSIVLFKNEFKELDDSLKKQLTIIKNLIQDIFKKITAIDKKIAAPEKARQRRNRFFHTSIAVAVGSYAFSTTIFIKALTSAIKLNRIDFAKSLLANAKLSHIKAYVLDVINNDDIHSLKILHQIDPNILKSDTDFIVNAVKHHHLKTVQLLLNTGAEINATSSDGSSLVDLAITEKQPKLVGLLFERGANSSDIPHHLKIITRLCLTDKAIDFVNNRQILQVLLVYAAKKDDFNAILLLQTSFEISDYHKLESQHQTQLSRQEFEHQYIHTIALWINAGYEISIYPQRIFLSPAVLLNILDAIAQLGMLPATVNDIQLQHKGLIGLFEYAVTNNFTPVVVKLLPIIDLDKALRCKKYLLVNLVKNNNIGMLDFLLKYGAPANGIDNNGELLSTALQGRDKVEIIKVLLRNGAQITKIEMRALELLHERHADYLHIYRLFFAAGLSPNAIIPGVRVPIIIQAIAYDDLALITLISEQKDLDDLTLEDALHQAIGRVIDSSPEQLTKRTATVQQLLAITKTRKNSAAIISEVQSIILRSYAEKSLPTIEALLDLQTSTSPPKFDTTIPNLIKQGFNLGPIAFYAISSGTKWLFNHRTPKKPAIAVKNPPIETTITPVMPLIIEPTPAAKRNYGLTKPPETLGFNEILTVLDFIIRWKQIQPTKIATHLISFFTARTLNFDDIYQLIIKYPRKIKDTLTTINQLEPSAQLLDSVNDNSLHAAKTLLVNITKTIYQSLKTNSITSSTFNNIEETFKKIDPLLSQSSKTIKTLKQTIRQAKHGKTYDLRWQHGKLTATRLTHTQSKARNAYAP